jgi:prepilin-type processing-associated H-X9-DG protein
VLTPLASPPALNRDNAGAAPIQLRSAATALKEATSTQRVLPLWLESTVKSEQPWVLICADSDGGSLAPDLSTVLYLSEGAAWAVPLTRLSRQQVLTQIREAQRQAAVSNAKQIGLAFAMYAQDYDQTFPPAGEAVMGQISPYVKNREVFVSPGESGPSFVYMMDGPTLGSIKEPATQELGYLPGPGGRAVVFVDGHVEWRGDRPDGPGARPTPGGPHFR